MGLGEVMNFVWDKLKEALLAVENVGGEALAWFDRVFPPETRAEKIGHWFHVALPYLIAAAVLAVVVCFCRRCFGCCRCSCCCCCCDRRDDDDNESYYHEDVDELMVKMMKAPGRNCRMPRPDFESDPRGYFRKLRSHPGDELC